MKRIFDFCSALLGLVVLSPLLVLIAAAVWSEDRCSPFFRGRRVARQTSEGRPMLTTFLMLKFRTMVPDAWKTGVSSTAAGDRRITRVGAWLRRAKLDELPQLWNVLVGDMSLVGPRPQVEADAAMYTPVERRMLSVRPGVTDLASIVFSDEGAILSAGGSVGTQSPPPSTNADLLYNQIIRPWKSRLALLYLERGSVLCDLQIIALTLMGAVSREWALRGVERMLRPWHPEPMLLKMARRQEPLVAWPPPGAVEIVSCYGRPSGASMPTVQTQISSGRATHA